MKYITLRPFLFVVFFFVLLFSNLLSLNVEAQSCTIGNTAEVNKPGWRQGANVPVYINPGIQGEQ